MDEPEKIIIVAMTRKGVIGSGPSLPWHIPDDLRLFRQTTMGHTLLMGRRTFESIGRPLPGRRTLVISRSLAAVEGVEVCRSFEEGLATARGYGRTVFFAGGASIYRRALAVADAMIVSWVERDYAGDVFFPAFDLRAWTQVEAEKHAEFTRIVYRRR